jgi:hypothetical protein
MAWLEQQAIQQPQKIVLAEMAASINHKNDACKAVKNGTEYWKFLKGRPFYSAVPFLLWINVCKSCKVKMTLQWGIIRRTYKKKYVLCTSCIVDGVEMTPEVRISRTCTVFGVIVGCCLCGLTLAATWCDRYWGRWCQFTFTPFGFCMALRVAAEHPTRTRHLWRPTVRSLKPESETLCLCHEAVSPNLPALMTWHSFCFSVTDLFDWCERGICLYAPWSMTVRRTVPVSRLCLPAFPYLLVSFLLLHHHPSCWQKDMIVCHFNPLCSPGVLANLRISTYLNFFFFFLFYNLKLNLS